MKMIRHQETGTQAVRKTTASNAVIDQGPKHYNRNTVTTPVLYRKVDLCLKVALKIDLTVQLLQ